MEFEQDVNEDVFDDEDQEQEFADDQDVDDHNDNDDDENNDDDDDENSDSYQEENTDSANKEDEADSLSNEDLDKIADTAIDTLRGILAYFDAKDAEIDEYEGEEGELILDVVGANLAVLIGRYGKSLDALQFIVAAVVNKKIGFRYPIIVDIESYRDRRRQKLESMAKSAAARCIRDKKDVRLRPMTPYERRIIHIILRDENRVITESEGEEPNRLIVIKPNR